MLKKNEPEWPIIDWTAFEQQQTSAGEVPEWALERVYELWQDTSLLEAFARYIATHEPKGEVPKLLTEAEWRELLSTAWVDPDEKLPELRERGLIAPEPEPDALLAEELAAVKEREAKLREALGALITELDFLNYAADQDDGPAIIAARAALSEQQP